jgi:Na+/H+ antiporter NhaD/arsenite permease-like protein
VDFCCSRSCCSAATLHHHTLKVALLGATAITFYQLFVTGFKTGEGMAGLAAHFGHEWVTLANLLGLLLGFALLADHFEKSRLPEVLPHLLPDDWKGGFALLAGVFVMSGFLDNIAAAMIGGTMAKVLFRRKVHIGYLAAIVAASNAGGAGSVVGDTTTTMIWIAGGNPLAVLEAYVGGAVRWPSSARLPRSSSTPTSRSSVTTHPASTSITCGSWWWR